MGIKCYLVTLRLSAMSADSPLPESVSRHIEQCEHCREEAAAYRSLKMALSESLDDGEKCRLTWAEIRASVTAYPVKTSGIRRMLVPVATACTVFLAFAGAFWAMQKSQQPLEPFVKQQQKALVKETMPNPNEALTKVIPQTGQKTEPSATEVAVNEKPDPKPQQKKAHIVYAKKPNRPEPVRHYNKPMVKADPLREETVVVSNAQSEANQVNVESETPVVSTEEHVIGVIGVNMEAPKRNDSYVIHQVSQKRYVSLDL